MKRSSVRLFNCLSHHSTAACGGFAAERRASRRSIDSGERPAAAAQHGAEKQMRAVSC